MAPDANPKLQRELRQEIEQRDGITFARFMEQALYHPDYGYYCAPRSRVGRQGDFFTSSSVHACFGRLIARQLEQMWHLLGGGSFTIAEQGAGEGHLCLDILDGLAQDYPDCYAQVDYRIVEFGDAACARQRQLLADHVAAGRVDWCTLDELQGMEGCLLSNELVDAFPVHLVEKHADRLKEVFVVNRAEGFAEELREPSTQALSDYFAAAGIALGPGNRCEVSLAAGDWMRRVASILKRGFVLTIDYGYPDVELYAPWRHGGTLLCYRQHATSEDPYQRVGEQDITAHVDFTQLQRVGQEAGLEPLYFGYQYQFLLALGFLELLIALQGKVQDEAQALALRMTLKNLILPEGGMGESFRVLVQGKDVAAAGLLCQRRIRDISLPPGH
jgi:SAM-dependent MidA family methyltransferase